MLYLSTKSFALINRFGYQLCDLIFVRVLCDAMPKSNRKQYWKINLNEFECRLQTKTRQTNQSSRQAFAFFTFMSNDQKHWAALFQIFFTSLSVQTNQFQFFFVQLPLNVCAQKRALFFSLFLVSTIVDLCLNVMQVSQCKMLYSILVLSTTNALAYFTFCYCYFYFLLSGNV